MCGRREARTSRQGVPGRHWRLSCSPSAPDDPLTLASTQSGEKAQPRISAMGTSLCKLGKPPTSSASPFLHPQDGDGDSADGGGRWAGAHLTPGQRGLRFHGHSAWHGACSRHMSMDRAPEWPRRSQGRGTPEGPQGQTDGPRPRASPYQRPSQAGSGRPAGPRADRRAGRRGRAGGRREKGGHCLLKPNQGATVTMRGILSGETDMPFFSPTAAKTAHWI